MSNELKLEKWKNYIKKQLKYHLNLFVEFRIFGGRTSQRTCDPFCDLEEIGKSELLHIIKNILNEMNTSYIVSTRSDGDSTMAYFIVVSIIQDKNLNINSDKKNS